VNHSRRLKILLWCSTIFWGTLVYLNWIYDRSHWLALFLSVFFLLLHLFGQALLMERITLDSQGLTSWLPFGKQHIAWDEIEKVRMGTTGQTVVIEGMEGRMVISGLRHWHGEQAGMARKYFLQQIETRNITPDLDRWVELRIFVSNLGSRQA
jgi:hypothetical protein